MDQQQENADFSQLSAPIEIADGKGTISTLACDPKYPRTDMNLANPHNQSYTARREPLPVRQPLQVSLKEQNMPT